MFEYNRNINRAKRYTYNNNNNNNRNSYNQNNNNSMKLEINEEIYRSEIADLYESSLSSRIFNEAELQDFKCQGVKLAHDAVIFDRLKMSNEHLKELYKNQGLIVGEYFAFLAPMVFHSILEFNKLNIFFRINRFQTCAPNHSIVARIMLENGRNRSTKEFSKNETGEKLTATRKTTMTRRYNSVRATDRQVVLAVAPAAQARTKRC